MCYAARGIWIVEDWGDLCRTGLRVRQGHFIMVPRNDDVILKPHARNQRRPWRVLLQAIVVSAEMVNKISGRDLVDRLASKTEPISD